MTTTVTAPPVPAVAPEARGTTAIADRAVARIATHALSEMDDVGGAARRVLGIEVGGDNSDAIVSATVTGPRVALTVRLSVPYPMSVRQVTEGARVHLTERVGGLTGLAVTTVDITVTALPNAAATTRRVR